MLRRLHILPTTAATASLLKATSTAIVAASFTVALRTIRGASNQYNPLHTFTNNTTGALHSSEQASDDLTFAEFKALVTNPGPLRVVFSDDYLDWYYRAFKEKVRFDRAKRAAASKGINSGANPIDAVNNTNNSNSASASSSQFTTPVKPLGSPARALGEAVMNTAQQRIDRAAVQHGLLDLFERCPQFPQVHIDRATDEHIPMLLDEFILRAEISASDVWRRALIARAVLLHNRRSYPKEFEYIFKQIDACVFSKPMGLSSSSAADTATDEDADKNKSGDKQQQQHKENQSASHIASELLEDSATRRFPTLALARYYEYLVRKYNIQNSSEAHVLLRCHLAPDAETLLFSNPPPEEERDKSKIGGGPDWERALALPLPPLEALLGDEPGNLALARVLLFAELNCHASNSDVFHKFPRAQSLVSRPSLSETREEHERSSLVARLQHRRHHILPTMVQFTIISIDTKGREANRLARQSEHSDMNWATSGAMAIERGGGGGDAGGDGSIAGTVFNHRAIRAELRDTVNQRLVSGLKQYRHGRTFTERPTLISAEDFTRFRTDGQNSSPSISLLTTNTALEFLKATLPKFVALVEGDKHVSLVLALMSQSRLGVRVQRLAREYARQLLQLALEFHLPKSRAVQVRAVRVAASLLDTAVVEGLEVLIEQQRELESNLRKVQQQHQKQKQKQAKTKEGDDNSADKNDAAGVIDRDPMLTLSALGGGSVNAILAESYVPFADRALDELGFPTEAKFADHARSMGIEI